MRQSVELFGMMSHRFQIDESSINDDSQRRERISSYDSSKIMDPRDEPGLRTVELFSD